MVNYATVVQLCSSGESRTKRPVDKKAVVQKGRRTKRPGDGKACLFEAPRTRRLDWADSNVECLLELGLEFIVVIPMWDKHGNGIET